MLVFIGTLHNHLTPNEELIKIIESYHPSRILVEITQEDIDSGNMEKYPPEMQAALIWAIDNRIEAYGMDSDINTLKEKLLRKISSNWTSSSASL